MLLLQVSVFFLFPPPALNSVRSVAMKAFAGYLSLFLTGWLLSPSLSVNSTSEIILVPVSDTYFYVNYPQSFNEL